MNAASIERTNLVFPLAKEWKNDECMIAHYACYSEKEELSPDLIQFWKTLMQWSCLGVDYNDETQELKIDHPPSLLTSVETLVEHFQWRGYTPSQETLNLLFSIWNVEQQILIPVETIDRTHDDGYGYSRLIPRWGRPAVKVVATTTPQQSMLVVRPVVDELSQVILSFVYAHHQKRGYIFCLPQSQHLSCIHDPAMFILNFESLCRECAKEQTRGSAVSVFLLTHLSTSQLLILVQYLVYTKKAVVDNQIITFYPADATLNSWMSRFSMLSLFNTFSKDTHSTDVNVFRLRHSLVQLTQSLAVFMEKLGHQRQCVRRKTREQDLAGAKRHLRLVKYLEKLYEERHQVVLNIEQSLITIEHCQEQHDSVQSIQLATLTLRNLHERLGVDEVEQAVEEWKDCLDEQDQIDQLLTSSHGSMSFNEDELEKELNAMMMMEQQTQSSVVAIEPSTVPLVVVGSQTNSKKKARSTQRVLEAPSM